MRRLSALLAVATAAAACSGPPPPVPPSLVFPEAHAGDRRCHARGAPRRRPARGAGDVCGWKRRRATSSRGPLPSGGGTGTRSCSRSDAWRSSTRRGASFSSRTSRPWSAVATCRYRPRPSTAGRSRRPRAAREGRGGWSRRLSPTPDDRFAGSGRVLLNCSPGARYPSNSFSCARRPVIREGPAAGPCSGARHLHRDRPRTLSSRADEKNRGAQTSSARPGGRPRNRCAILPRRCRRACPVGSAWTANCNRQKG